MYCIEDGSETTVNTNRESSAKTSCYNRCASTNSFYAIKLLKVGSWRCKCLDLTLEPVVAEVNTSYVVILPHNLLQSRVTTDPLNEIQCPEATDVHKDEFQSDSALMNFLTSSTESLETSEGKDDDGQQRKNICNSERTADIVTLYLAKVLGLSTGDIVNNFVYDFNETYVFPMNNSQGPSNTYPPPTNSYHFPGLYRTYWTILSHYTSTTEPGLRAGKSGNTRESFQFPFSYFIK